MFTKAAKAFRAAGRASNEPARNTERTTRAVHPETAVDPSIWEDHEYGNLLAQNHSGRMAHGLWICSSCQAENNLVHVEGAYPFKYLVCRACEHVFCGECISSDVLNMEPSHGFNIAVPSSQFGLICSACGLTHRAGENMGGIRCACGSRVNSAWMPFVIGRSDDYRYDPNACAVNLKMAFHDRAIRRQFGSVQDISDSGPVATRQSSRHTTEIVPTAPSATQAVIPQLLPQAPAPAYTSPHARSSSVIRHNPPPTNTHATLSGPWEPECPLDFDSSERVQSTLSGPWSPDYPAEYARRSNSADWV
ncbi:hypothetical protein NX059_007339 [Plenodomus lindquistii]|nr:hypothetical protein NX059_007339 [Plenodomus lindquistii]